MRLSDFQVVPALISLAHTQKHSACVHLDCASALNLECWTQVDGVRGRKGAAYKIGHLEQCQQLCIRKLKCVAINFATIKRGSICKILTTTAAEPLSPKLKKIVQYYRLDRDCVRLPSTLQWRSHDFILGSINFTV